MKFQVTILPLRHKGEDRIQVHFSHDNSLIVRLMEIPDCQWSQTRHCWHVPYTTEVYLHLANRYNREIRSPLEDLDL